MAEKKKKEPSGQNRILQQALASVHPDARVTQMVALRNGATALPHEDGYDPLFDVVCGNDTEKAELIIKAVMHESRVFKEGEVLDEAETKKALAKNLFNRHQHSELSRTPLEVAAGNDAKGMFPMVWSYFKDNTDINTLYNSGNCLLHWAATYPENVKFLLAQGAHVDVRDKIGRTPLMKMFDGSYAVSFTTDIDDLIKVYEDHGANINAVDEKGRGLPYWLLNTRSGNLTFPQLRCMDWTLDKGLDFMAVDEKGITPVDHFMRDSPTGTNPMGWQSVDDLFRRLADHGYNIPALREKYGDKLAVKEASVQLDFHKESVCRKLAEPELGDRLWRTDNDAPSHLLLAAFGHGVPKKIFEHPSLQSDPAAAKALYEKMEAKLPERCKWALHNTIDTSFLQRALEAPVSSAVTALLKRREAPGSDPSSPGRK